MKFKIDTEMIEQGYISERKHPTLDYYIYNYTAKAQYDGVWNSSTLGCRGLILNKNGNIIARPFSKFFNYGEYGKDTNLGELPSYKSFDVYEKLDGSLGILYIQPDGEIRVATRGSFESEQALKGTKILHKKFPKLIINPDLCYLVEIIYPENRIVVDYKGKEDLILLAITENATGLDVKRSLVESFANTWKFNITKKYNVKSIEELKRIMDLGTPDNEEGYVIQFNTGLRVKMKYEEYVRLHKIITGVNTKGIWEMMRDGQSLDELIEKVPDEFHKWFMETSGNFTKEYNKIEKKAKRLVGKAVVDLDDPDNNRKEVAKLFTGKRYKEISGIAFAMWDSKPYDKIIWKMVRPKQAKAFKEEI